VFQSILAHKEYSEALSALPSLSKFRISALKKQHFRYVIANEALLLRIFHNKEHIEDLKPSCVRRPLSKNTCRPDTRIYGNNLSSVLVT